MTRPLCLGLLALLCGAAAADVVILPDGFVIQGKHVKEREFDKGVLLPKGNGFDTLEDGPRRVVFSQHVRTGGKVEQTAPKPDPPTYRRQLPLKRGTKPLVGIDKPTVEPFNAKWEQHIKGLSLPSPQLPFGGAPVRLVRQVVSIDPSHLRMDSYTHQSAPEYQTSEFLPEAIRGFLITHPDLKEPAGKPDPARRLLIAGFLRDVSLTDPSGNGAAYLKAARAELDNLRAAVPALPADVAGQADKLRDDLLVAETRRVCDELEACTTSGRWLLARDVVGKFTPSALDPKESLRFAAAKATVETTFQKFEQTAGLLDGVLLQVAGPHGLDALGGGLAAAGPLAQASPAARDLFRPAVAVRAELHPDTVGRLELFSSQADARKRFPGAGATSPESLLALAVTGALKGKNGADPDPAVAARVWAARQAVTGYLRHDTVNARTAFLNAYLGANPAPADELAQVINLLAPPEPLDPANLGTPVPPTQAEGVPGIVRRTTPPAPAKGVEYALRLPPEFHPGRTYPVILALADPAFGPDRMVARLAEYADRFGYVVVSPQWASTFGPQGYDYRGVSHPAATVVLRDLFRRVRCDPDKVFAWGYGAGADFALDLGLAHPDLFAGVVANGAVPPQWLAVNYWRNAQKLPMYFVCGDAGGEYPAARSLFERWTVRGFPALMTVFKGRGSPDFFPAELPRIFDWMGRKTRVRGTASLRLGPGGVEPWQVVRESDDRFYWVGVGAGGLRRENLLADRATGIVEPAHFRADIGRNGVVQIDGVLGVRKFVVWLERDLIDWSKPLAVTVNGRTPPGFKPQPPKPDLHLLFDELHRSGDTKMLFLGKLEVDGPG